MAAPKLGIVKELLRCASGMLANGEIRLTGGLALLADAERQLADLRGEADGFRDAYDALSAHLLAATNLEDAGVDSSVILGVLYRGVCLCEAGLAAM